MKKVNIELTEVSKQLADAHGDTAESERNRKRNEAIENLKRVFPDRVYGRLVDLCQPSHRRFQIAITKVILLFFILFTLFFYKIIKFSSPFVLMQKFFIHIFIFLPSQLISTNS